MAPVPRHATAVGGLDDVSRPAPGRVGPPPPARLPAPPRPPRPVRPARRWPLAVVATGALLAFYVVASPGNRSGADDAFWYAKDVRDEGLGTLLGPLHFRHILYLPFARGLFDLAHALGLDVGSYDLLRLFSSVCAVGTVVLFWHLLRRSFGLPVFPTAAATAGLALSYGFWRYANEAENYAPANLTTVGFLLLASTGVFTSRRAVLTGVVATVAIGMNVLAAIPAGLVVVLWAWSAGRRRQAGVYLASVALLLLVAASASFALRADGSTGLTDHFLSTEASSGEASISPSAVPAAAAGGAQTVAGLEFLFSYDSVSDWLERAYPDRNLADRDYAAGDAGVVGQVVAPLLLVLAVAGAVVLVVVAARSPAPGRLRRVPLYPIALWALAHAVAGAALAPVNREAWIQILIPLWIGAAVVFDRVPSPRRALVVVTVALLGLQVAAGGLWLERSSSTDYDVRKASWLLANTGPDDVIVTAGSSAFARYLAYHAPGRVVETNGHDSAELSRRFDEATDGAARVFATGDLFDPARRPASCGPGCGTDDLAARLQSSAQPVHTDEFGGAFCIEGEGRGTACPPAG